MRDAEKTVGLIADKQKIAYISSIDEEGFPTIRAMLRPNKREGIKTFYFSTNTSSAKINQYIAEPKSCIYFCDHRFFRGVMLKGTMEVLQDAQIKEMLWRRGDSMYYPLGVSDPDYCILKFTATSGKYYSNFKTEGFDI